MNNNQNNTPSLFGSNTENEGDSQEDKIESKLHKRQQYFSNEDNFSKIKENTMQNELSLGHNFRNKMFNLKRLKQNMNTEVTQSLKNKLTIPLELYEKCNSMNVVLSQFSDIITSFRTPDINKKYFGLVGIRKLLSLNPSPIQELIDAEIIPELIGLLDNSPAEFQSEALSCLTNIASGTTDQANRILVKGGLQKLLKIMDSSIEELKIQVGYIIGTLANDSPYIRDTLIKEKVFDKLLTVLASTNQTKLIKQYIWSVSCFFRTKPIPSYDIIKKAIKIIARCFVMIEGDSDFLCDVVYILSFITEHYKEAIVDLFEFDVVKKIIKCLDIDNQRIQLSCLRVVGNIASGNANQTQSLVDMNILNYLKKAITSKAKFIRKEGTWIVSNIAAGTQRQIESLISENYLPTLIDIIKQDEDDIKKECIWAVCNLTSVENPIYIKKILEQNILGIICDCLKMTDAKYLAVCLEALNNLLLFGKKNSNNGINPLVVEIEKMGMCDTLEQLQYHPVDFVYEKTLKLLEIYFEVKYNE
jgi:hypothetical protein